MEVIVIDGGSGRWSWAGRSPTLEARRRRLATVSPRLVSFALLHLRERLSLRLQLAICSVCRECDRQFTLLHGVGSHFDPESRDNDGTG